MLEIHTHRGIGSIHSWILVQEKHLYKISCKNTERAPKKENARFFDTAVVSSSVIFPFVSLAGQSHHPLLYTVYQLIQRHGALTR